MSFESWQQLEDKIMSRIDNTQDSSTYPAIYGPDHFKSVWQSKRPDIGEVVRKSLRSAYENYNGEDTVTLNWPLVGGESLHQVEVCTYLRELGFSVSFSESEPPPRYVRARIHLHIDHQNP